MSADLSITRYLATTRSPFENLTLVSQGKTMTREVAEFEEELTRQAFPVKISVLGITALAIAVIGLVIAAVKVKPGVVLASLCVVPLVGAYYQYRRKKFFVSRWETLSNDIRIIYGAMTRYLDEQRAVKETALIEAFNDLKLSTESLAVQPRIELAKLNVRYNAGEVLIEKYGKHSAEYKIVLPLVLCVFDMQTPVIPLPESCWKKFVQSCHKFAPCGGDASDLYVDFEAHFLNKQWEAKRFS